MRTELQNVFEAKTWSCGPDVPRSGPGSTLAATAPLRAALPGIFARYDIKRFIDAPCGDWFWMQHVDLNGIDYLGADISASLIAENKKHHARAGVRFDVLDVTSSALPESDLFLCRDCLFHLQFALRWAFFQNFVNSNGKYLLLTVNHVPRNRMLQANGGYAGFDPMLAPFEFPEPIERIQETSAGAEAVAVDTEIARKQTFAGRQRSLGLWTRDQVAGALKRRAQATMVS